MTCTRHIGFVSGVVCAALLGSATVFAEPLPVHELEFTEAVAGDFSGLPAQSDPRFGASVAMDGGWLAVGAPYTIAEVDPNDGTSLNGAVFLFHFEDGHWQYKDRFIVTGLHDSLCGRSVAMALPWLVVGCPNADDDDPGGFSESPEGRVDLYRLDSNGVWTAYDSWAGTEADGGCGAGVALAIGPGESAMLAYGCFRIAGFISFTETRHVALVDYNPDTGVWSQAHILSPSVPPEALTRYGSELALHPGGRFGDPARLLVGAPYLSGQVYLYELQSQWVQLDVIDNPAPLGVDSFGASLALFGDDLWVGAPRATASHANCQTADGCGRVNRYLYTANPATLEETAEVIPTDNLGGEPPGPQAEMQFGFALALSTPGSVPDGLCSGDLVAISAPMTDGPDTNSGYVALRAARDIDGLQGRCGELRIPSNLLGGSAEFQFGYAVDFGSEYRLAVGVPGHKGFLAPRTGRVWIYRHDRIFMDGFD